MKKLRISRVWVKRFVMIIAVTGVGLSSTVFLLSRASAVAQGDGLLFYGASSNTNPQLRTYTASTNSHGSAGGTVNGTQPLATVIKTSPTKFEAIAGYVNGSGTLQVMCYNGVSWSNEWSVTVGGTGTTRRFDIAYETSSGDAIVLYGNNGASLGYQTKSGSTGCGNANWSGASTFTPARTTGTVQWVKLASDTRGSSNLIAAIWADGASDLSSQIWSGSAWGNEPSAALSTTLDTASAAQDIESFDLGYESTSGDLLVVWGIAGTTGTTGKILYIECQGGTSGCTWTTAANPGGSTTIGTVADLGTMIDIGVDPASNQISMAAIDDGGGANSCDMSTALWDGSSWSSVVANAEITAECPTAGQKTISTFWLNNGSAKRRVIVYDDASGTAMDWMSYNGATVTNQTDYTTSPTLNDVRARYNSEVNPFDNSQAIVNIVDSTGALYAKRITMDGTGSLGTSNWSAGDGSASLGTVSQTTVGDFSFAYWLHMPAPTYNQTAYGWYSNANSVTPGSILGSENTPYTLTSVASPIRLRAQLTIGTDPMLASSQAFLLQYATSTSGPWTTVGGGWWNSSWGSRRKITFDNSASSSNLTDFPVRVSLSASNIDYSKTQNAGQDIRFVDSDGTPLKYEIENWNESGTSEVWVKVPQVDAGSTTDYVWMYYDNNSASDGQDVANTWNANFKGVWHLKENPDSTGSAPQVADSTGVNNGTTTGMVSGDSITGQIYNALNFDATNNSVDAGNNSSLDVTTNTMTTSMWIKRATTSAVGYLVTRGVAGTSGYGFGIGSNDSSGCGTNTIQASKMGVVHACVGAVPADTNWHFISVVWSGSGATAYIDGNASTPTNANTTNIITSTTNFKIGSDSAGGQVFNGGIDELRMSNVALSADWIKATYKTQALTFNSYGSEETYSVPEFTFYDNATPADGAALSSAIISTSDSDVYQSYQEGNPTPVNPVSAAAGKKAEWDFSLDPAGATNGNTYYFRMIKSNGSGLDTYTSYPQLTISLSGGGGPTLDQQMRGGQSVVNGVKQPFSF